jgi:hypothetical protein
MHDHVYSHNISDHENIYEIHTTNHVDHNYSYSSPTDNPDVKEPEKNSINSIFPSANNIGLFSTFLTTSAYEIGLKQEPVLLKEFWCVSMIKRICFGGF